jgi:hypothetical protein
MANEYPIKFLSRKVAEETYTHIIDDWIVKFNLFLKPSAAFEGMRSHPTCGGIREYTEGATAG